MGVIFRKNAFYVTGNTAYVIIFVSIFAKTPAVYTKFSFSNSELDVSKL